MEPSRHPPLLQGAVLMGVLSVVACSDPLLPVSPPSPEETASIVAANREALSLAPGTVGHVVVLGAEKAPSKALMTAIEAAGGRIVKRYDRIGVLIAKGLSDADAAKLRSRSEVAAASRDRLVQWQPDVSGLTVRNAPVKAAGNPAGAVFYDLQWNMRQIQADKAWEVTPQGKNSRVCVLDSGIDPTHLDLEGKVDFARSASFIAEPVIPEIPVLAGQFDIIDYRFHGTFVASQIATNGIGMASVAPRTSLCVVKVLNVFGTGSFEALIAGVIHSADVRADVINMSVGAYLDLALVDGPLKALLIALQRAILYANARGSLVVASSGNDGIDLDADGTMIHVPSQMLGVLSVSATGPTNQADFDDLAAYSNFGRTGVILAAPGGNAGELGIFEDGIFGVCSSFQLTLPFACDQVSFIGGGDGTSFAAPHVTGLAAVVESGAPANQNSVDLANCAILGADRIDGQKFSASYGFGRIDVFDAVKREGCGPANLVASHN